MRKYDSPTYAYRVFYLSMLGLSVVITSLWAGWYL